MTTNPLPSALCRAYRRGEVALIVGAGTSQGCDHLGWHDLSQTVVASVPRPKRPSLGSIAASQRLGKPVPHDPGLLHSLKQKLVAAENELIAMRHVRFDRSVDLPELVQAVLYSRQHPLSPTVLRIPTLTRVRKICCYNYDDILERAFAQAGVPHISLFRNQPIPFERSETLIFYPHGYLPDPQHPTLPETPDIVLSEDDYFSLYSTPYAWANLVQLTLLQNYTALFVGCSLTDPNLRRLLQIASSARPDHRHFAILKLPKSSPKLPRWLAANELAAYRSVKQQELGTLSVVPVWVAKYQEIDATLAALCNDALYLPKEEP